jgi:biopolymer transport protein ExbB
MHKRSATEPQESAVADLAGVSLFSLLLKGGWTMVPLLILSVVGLTVIVQKALQFRRERLASDQPLKWVADYSKTGDLAALESACAKEGTPLGHVLMTCAETLRTTPARAMDEVQRAATVELDRLERSLPILSFIAQAAPLFGLLGTVIGMVELFAAMDAAGARIETGMLSSGIWQALLTTAAGLIIAIPALAGYVWLTRRVARLRVKMEDGAGRMLTAFAALAKRAAHGGE